MGGIEYIKEKSRVLAVIIRKKYQPRRIEFVTPEQSAQEAGFLRYEKGREVKPHIHILNKRIVYGTPETVCIRSGKVKYSFYDSKGVFIKSSVLTQGDIVVLLGGGHGQRFVNETLVFVVKQGPYLKEKDKIFIKDKI